MPNPPSLALPSSWRIVQCVRRLGLPWAALLVAGQLLLARPLVSQPAGFDETYYVWEGWAVNHGLVPYRDFIEFKAPVVFWVNGLALSLFGVDGLAYRWLFVLLFIVSTVTLLVALCQRGTDRLVAFAAVALVAFAVLKPGFHDSSLDDAETTGIAFFLLGCAALLWRGRPAWTPALGGAALALSVLSKEPFVLAVLPTWVALGYLGRDEHIRSWKRYAQLTVAGAATVAVPVLLYLLATGAVPQYLRDMRVYLGYAQRIGCARPSSTVEVIGQAWPRFVDKLFTDELVLPGLPLALAAVILPPAGIAARLALAGAVAGGLYAVTLGGCYFNHYFLLGLTGLALAVVVGAAMFGRRLFTLPRVARHVTRATLLALMVWQLYPAVNAELHTDRPDLSTVDTLVDPDAVALVKARTRPDDTILSDVSPALYVLTGRRPALRETCLVDELIDERGGRTDEQRLAPLRAQLLLHKPKALYLAPALTARKQRIRRALIDPFIRAFKYRLIGADLYLRP
jgi:hypothetical protein